VLVKVPDEHRPVCTGSEEPCHIRAERQTANVSLMAIQSDDLLAPPDIKKSRASTQGRHCQQIAVPGIGMHTVRNVAEIKTKIKTAPFMPRQCIKKAHPATSVRIAKRKPTVKRQNSAIVGDDGDRAASMPLLSWLRFPKACFVVVRPLASNH